jgi:pSer/pThr/pTyr-binding forkhead associated (FHA) protein
VPPFVLTVLKIVLLLLLYFFVWRAVRTVTVDLYGGREPRARPAEPRRRAPRRQRRGAPSKVVVLDERGGRSGTHRLSGTIQIGRASSCQIRPNDTYVSQFHARISNRNGSWVVEDLGSTNGTYLNQRKVTVPTELTTGDRIRVGKTILEVRK